MGTDTKDKTPNKSSKDHCTPSPEEHREAKASAQKRKKAKRGRFNNTGANLLDEISTDRQQEAKERAEKQYQLDLSLAYKAQESDCVMAVKPWMLKHLGALTWLSTYLDLPPSRRRYELTFDRAKQQLRFSALKQHERRQLHEGMCRAFQAFDTARRETRDSFQELLMSV